jgi:hypothetical protein
MAEKTQKIKGFVAMTPKKFESKSGKSGYAMRIGVHMKRGTRYYGVFAYASARELLAGWTKVKGKWQRCHALVKGDEVTIQGVVSSSQEVNGKGKIEKKYTIRCWEKAHVSFIEDDMPDRQESTDDMPSREDAC